MNKLATDRYEWDQEISVLEYQIQDMKHMPRIYRKEHAARLEKVREDLNDLIGEGSGK